jgi:hypothetical protein
MAETLLDQDFVRRLEQLSLVSRKVALGKYKGERKSRHRGSSTEFADYRNYVHGDDLRFLDWKIYGRLERLFIKLFLEEEDLRVDLFVDTSASMRFGEPEKLLYAKRAAAALGYLCLVQSDRLTVRTFGRSIAQTFGPKRGKVNGNALFRFLEEAEEAEGTSLEGAVRQFTRSTRTRGVVVLISDFYDFDGYEQAFKPLFGGNFEGVALHVPSPQELEPALEGDIRLVDGEQGLTTDVSMGPAVLDLYARTLNEFCDGLRSHLVNRGGSYILTSTALPFERLVLDVLRRRGLVR